MMRLEDRVGLGHSPVLLEPFGHQVAGQASMLTVDAVTVCKPLIPREHFVYRTLPPQLSPFTPYYKGVLYVRLEEEEDGRIKLLGFHPDVDDDNVELTVTRDYEEDESLLQAPSQFSSGTSTPISSGSEADVPSAVESERMEATSKSLPGCVVRVLQCGTYEVSASTTSDSRFIAHPHRHSDDNASAGSRETSGPTSPVAQPLNPWGLSCHTRLLDKMRKSNLSPHGCSFLQLENVVARFARPCILDLKVGSRLHGDNATQQKIASQSHKCSTTTSRSLGLRLCGMQVYRADTGAYKSLDKYHGRKLTDITFPAVLRDFLHNGQRLRRELLPPILSRLTDLVSTLEQLDSFRFYASSLLIMYDGVCQETEDTCCGSQQEREEAGHKQRQCGVSGQQAQAGSCHQLPQVLITGDQDEALKAQASTASTVTVTSRSRQRALPKEDRSVSATSSTTSDKKKSGSDAALCQDNGNTDSERLLVDVRMIDFAHTTHSGFPDDVIVHEGPDRDYISGLRNLIRLFSQLAAQS